MPVSKKRKKEGKPVHRAPERTAEQAAGGEGVETKPAHPQQRVGKPTNPFVGQHQTPRHGQRGR